ncbi:MAG: hypothetical protein JO056_10875 [Alphaproteobacteria bacterium]|nr:hypothetical protein [Alphaproteobacteria bacterium]
MSSQHEPTSPYLAEGTELTPPERSDDAGQGQGNRSSGVKGQISELAQTAKSQASAAIQPIAKNAKSMAEEQKSRGAERLGGIAQAVHGAADEIAREVPFAADYIHSVAGKLDDASGLLRDNSVEDLARMAIDFAEERPVVFIGSALAAGFVVSRLLRSSVTLADEDEE